MQIDPQRGTLAYQEIEQRADAKHAGVEHDHADAQVALDMPVQRLGGMEEIAECLERLLGTGQKFLPALGERHGRPGSRKQLQAQFLLKLSQLPADRGLRDVQRLCRPGDVAEAGHRDEGAKLPDVHYLVRLRMGAVLVALGAGWIWHELATKPLLVAISGLNTYNLMFLLAGMLLHWRPRSFLDAAARAVPATTGVLIQFPLYGAIASMLTAAQGPDGASLSHHLSTLFVSISSSGSYPLMMGVYSGVLGFLVPSGGGKWIIEAPYVMQAANDLRVHLGWAVQIYNAAEALPNLINPFWMLPLLGILGLKARDLVGFTFTQFLTHTPVVLVLLWALARTLPYAPPVLP